MKTEAQEHRFILLGNLLLINILLVACGASSNTISAPGQASDIPMPQAAAVPSAPRVRKIAFSAWLDEPSATSYEIYSMNADGSGLINLTNNPARDANPAWSPDEKQIVFCSIRDGKNEVYLMNADGSDQHLLTDKITDCANPSWSLPVWSPDGKWIAISSALGSAYPQGTLDIFIISPDGSKVINLSNNPANDMGFVWSPDSSQISFVSDRDGNEETYIMDINGNNVTRLTNNPARDSGGVWSPDGSHLLFLSNRDGNWEIYVMNPDGSNQTRLTDNSASDLSPIWSPDGKYIYFTSKRDGNTEVYRMNPDGSGQVNLTDSPVEDYWYWLSPDGSQIAVAACLEQCQSSESKWDTFMMNSDGTDKRELLKVGSAISWKP